MASSYVQTLLLDALYKANNSDVFQSFEIRPSVYGALDAAWKMRNDILPAATIEGMKKSSARLNKIDVFKKEAAGAGTARKCTGTGDGSTARVTLSWQTVMEEFSISKLDLAQNNYTFQEMFSKRFNEKLKNLAKRIDAIVVAMLEANYTAGNGDNFVTFNNAFQVPESEWNLAANLASLWINSMKADMFKNDLDQDQIHMVGDANMQGIMNSLIAQGSANSVNTFFQMSGLTGSFTNRIVNNGGIKATGYGFQKGAFGILTWINQLESEGENTGTHIWTNFTMPRYGFKVGLKETITCADNSANVPGAEADSVHGYVLAVDISTPVQYSSDGNSGIYKYELDSDDNTLSGSGSYE